MTVGTSAPSLARRVFGGSGLIAVASALARVCALISFPLLSRWLGPAPYGIYSLASTLVGLAATLGLMGLDMAYARHYLDGDADERQAVEAFCWSRALAASLFAALVATGVWVVVARHVAGQDQRLVMVYLPLAICLSALSTLAGTRTRLVGAYRKLAQTTVLAALCSSGLALLVAAAGMRGVVPLLMGGLVTSAVMVLLLGAPRPAMLVGALEQLPPRRRRELWQLGISCAITGPLYWLISSSDRWFLAATASDADVGIYATASTIALMGIMVNSAVHLALFPEASRLYGDGSRAELQQLARLWERLAVVLLIVMLLVGSLGGGALRMLTAVSFHSGTAVIPWLALGAFLYGLAGLGNLPFFLERRMGVVALNWVIAALVCLLANALLIPRFGAVGASLAQCITYGVLVVLTLVGGRGLLALPVHWRRLGTVFLLALVVLAAFNHADLAQAWLELLGKGLALLPVCLGLWLLGSGSSLEDFRQQLLQLSSVLE